MSSILKPSQIGAVLPLDKNIVLNMDGKKFRENSTDVIDDFIDCSYDNYEITCIRVEKYGWLVIDMVTIE